MFFFCNKCHRRIIPPKFLLQANINGRIKLSCGHTDSKGVKCDGFAVKGKKQKEIPVSVE